MSIENRLRTCLRVWHPEVPLEELSELLGRPPQNFGVRGTVLGRTRDSSLVSTWQHNYWGADFTRGDDLEDRVDEVFDALARRADTFSVGCEGHRPRGECLAEARGGARTNRNVDGRALSGQAYQAHFSGAGPAS